MPVDPCFAALLADRRNELRPPPAHVSIDDVRTANRAFLSAAPKVELHRVDELACPSPGGTIRLRAYRPTSSPDQPVVLFMHGGGFVLGDLDSHDSICHQLAASSRCTVIAVDYRLAPEVKFPVPLDDCAAALDWVMRSAQALGVDGRRLAFCGDSAGGNLAAALAARQRASGHAVRYLGLLYPVVGPACDTGSMHEFARGHLLSRAAMQWLWTQYLPTEADSRHPDAALLCGELGGMPPTTIVTAECDPLRDEGEALAARLSAAGVPVVLRRYAGMVHGFAGLPQFTPVATEALQALGADIRAALTRNR